MRQGLHSRPYLIQAARRGAACFDRRSADQAWLRMVRAMTNRLQETIELQT